MATKLIIVEGLPGSGKSTTAQHMCDILNAKGIDTELYSEGNFNHPADFDGVAYFDSEEFNILEKTHSSLNQPYRHLFGGGLWSIIQNFGVH